MLFLRDFGLLKSIGWVWLISLVAPHRLLSGCNDFQLFSVFTISSSFYDLNNNFWIFDVKWVFDVISETSFMHLWQRGVEERSFVPCKKKKEGVLISQTHPIKQFKGISGYECVHLLPCNLNNLQLGLLVEPRRPWITLSLHRSMIALHSNGGINERAAADLRSPRHRSRSRPLTSLVPQWVPVTAAALQWQMICADDLSQASAPVTSMLKSPCQSYESLCFQGGDKPPVAHTRALWARKKHE